MRKSHSAAAGAIAAVRPPQVPCDQVTGDRAP